jgi:hypothetical protein
MVTTQTTTQWYYTWTGENPYNFHWDLKVLINSLVNIYILIIIILPFFIAIIFLALKVISKGGKK